jgi:hypothetical protein
MLNGLEAVQDLACEPIMALSISVATGDQASAVLYKVCSSPAYELLDADRSSSVTTMLASAWLCNCRTACDVIVWSSYLVNLLCKPSRFSHITSNAIEMRRSEACECVVYAVLASVWACRTRVLHSQENGLI